MNTSLVIIPTYNEVENLPLILKRALTATKLIDILVVDDSSSDGTGELADELSVQEPRISVLHRKIKDGLGRAYIAGFKLGLERGYEYVIEMDADGSHPPESLPRMLELLETHDLVLGSRWVTGGKVVNWPLRREILSRAGNFYARKMLRISVKDSTGGFRGYRTSLFKRIDLDQVASQGYGFQVDMLWRVWKANGRIIEFPITFVERIHGASKMSGNIISEALKSVTIWGIKDRFPHTKKF